MYHSKTVRGDIHRLILVDVFVVLPRLMPKPSASRSLLTMLQMLQNLEEPFPDVDETLLPLNDITL
ncbi:MAG: hypothetical protein HC790_08910 [Acaryochloridaceae cyanobacterium CSU_3_4]|nr:hypothetical protein [Acaryochloridaceae cyanobacterium CSU_3_4]